MYFIRKVNQHVRWWFSSNLRSFLLQQIGCKWLNSIHVQVTSLRLYVFVYCIEILRFYLHKKKKQFHVERIRYGFCLYDMTIASKVVCETILRSKIYYRSRMFRCACSALGSAIHFFCSLARTNYCDENKKNGR